MQVCLFEDLSGVLSTQGPSCSGNFLAKFMDKVFESFQTPDVQGGT